MSTIKGNVSDKTVGGVLIRAIPEDGNAPVHAISDDNGNYSLNIRPGVRYYLTGICYDPYGQYAGVDFRTRNGDICREVTLAPGETIMLPAFIYRVHPPMSLFETYDPVTGKTNVTPSTPVLISGHVYLEGNVVSGAEVEAIPVYGNYSSNATDASGNYTLVIDSKGQYNVTATYMGMRHTVWPVHLYDNETGVYDIYLSKTPRSTLNGIAANASDWPRRPGVVTIEAVPVDGGAPVKATVGPDLNFSLDVEPNVYYNLSGKFSGADGNYYGISLYYWTGVPCHGFMLRPNETALVCYFHTTESYAYLEASPKP